MKKYLPAVAILIVSILFAETVPAQTRFKRKKYFGPIPYNTLNLSIGFIDGPSAEYLTDHLLEWAKQRHGTESSEEMSTSPFARIGYERQVSPNHFFRASLCFSYLNISSFGDYVAQVTQADTMAAIPLDVERSFKVYLLSLDIGFLYYFIGPEVRRFSPFVGAGFSTVFPLTRLETDSFHNGEPFSNPGETVSRNSIEAGLHTEFGMVYYITNRYSAAIEGRYQMAQSKFYHHDANFDIDYHGFTLGLVLNYHF